MRAEPLRWILDLLAGNPRAQSIAEPLSHDDGAQVGRILAAHLPPREARRCAVAAMGLEHVLLTFDRDGIRWTVDTGDEIGELLFADGAYERDALDAMLAWLGQHRPRSTLVDVGANVGTTSIPFAQSGYRVVAIEPVPTTYQLLEQNVTVNGFSPQVACVPSAIAQSPGTVDMWTALGSGQSEVVVPGKSPGLSRWGKPERVVSVAATGLDQIVGELGVDAHDVALVWSDTQGSEAAVIATGSKLWSCGVPLFHEVDPHSLEIHGGLSNYLELVETHFCSFISRGALLEREAPISIDRYRSFVESMAAEGVDRYTDALLLPDPE